MSDPSESSLPRAGRPQLGESRPVLALAAVGLLAAGLSYQVRRPIEIELGRGLTAALLVDGFHDAEGGYRWTRASSALLLPDVGPGLDGRVEVELSGFRPPGQSPPLVLVEVYGQTLRVRPGNRVETITLPVRTGGLWVAPLPIRFRSETFSPSEFDRRPLGVRVHRLRFLPQGPGLGLARPSLRSLLAVPAAALLLFAFLLRAGFSRRSAFAAGLTAEMAAAAAFALLRTEAALATLPVLGVLGASTVFLAWFPATLSFAKELAAEIGRAWRQGLAALASRQSVVLVGVGVASVTAVTLLTPRFTVDVGSGAEAALARDFGPFDAEGGVSFRQARRGALLDLRDFGGGTSWTVAVTASLAAGGPRRLVLASAGDALAEPTLDRAWTTVSFVARAPADWRSGLRLSFPAASESLPLRIDRVQVERGRSLPSPRLLLVLMGAPLLLLVGLGAAGLAPLPRWVSAFGLLAGEVAALGASPVLTIPFAGRLLWILAGAAVLAGVLSGLWLVVHRRGNLPQPVPGAVAWTVVGFCVWLAATVFPLYRGQHFVYHSSIAEEIWNGRFLVFYLPHPENILSREAQWGGMVVPYPCLYHTLMAPLAALPQAWFYLLEKVALAGMLASMALAAALVAHRFGGPRASAAAAALTVSLHPTYQLLGLGHLLNIFGCWAAALALGYLVLGLDGLRGRAAWWSGLALLSLCFLSYTASLVFGVLTLAAAVAFLWPRDRLLARALAGVSLAASLAALALYYMHWILPFLRESVPILLTGDPEGSIAIGSRLAVFPRKLSYSYGSACIPLIGLAGVVRLWRSAEGRGGVLLACWAGILPLVSIFDLFFNFILKHHYFVMLPVVVGIATGLEWLARRSRTERAVALVLFVYALFVGARAAWQLSQGQMQ